MHLASPWKPRLSGDDGGPADRLATALAEDIADGALARGDRLPPHRELAYQLGIGLGTVTKAYAMLERRGLVESVRGRGMFVASLTPRPDAIVDLSINTPPQMLDDRLMAATLSAMAKRLDAGTFGAYAPVAGRQEHRALAARWLAGQGMEAAPDNILLCNGAQHALSIAFAAVCPPGGTVLTEATTYPGAIALARQAGYRLVGLALDGEGLRPDALEQALTSTAAAALYVTPTLNNPTGATMSAARRQDIARLCRQYDVAIIEDDVYSIFAKPGLPPLASLAPERTLYVNGLSKSISPGLRIGMLAVPRHLVERALSRLQATCTMASPLASMIMERWLTDGTAQSVAASIRMETEKRQALMKSLLPFDIPVHAINGFHAWLPMPTEEAERMASAATALGVIVTPPRLPLVDPSATDGGIRLCLGSPPIDRLKQALSLLMSLVNASGQRHPGDQPMF